MTQSNWSCLNHKSQLFKKFLSTLGWTLLFRNTDTSLIKIVLFHSRVNIFWQQKIYHNDTLHACCIAYEYCIRSGSVFGVFFGLEHVAALCSGGHELTASKWSQLQKRFTFCFSHYDGEEPIASRCKLCQTTRKEFKFPHGELWMFCVDKRASSSIKHALMTRFLRHLFAFNFAVFHKLSAVHPCALFRL